MGLQPITACVVSGKSTIFFVDDDEFVHTLTASQEQERSKGRTTYDDKILKVGGEEVKSLTKDLVALSYTLQGGTIRSRLFFADQNGILQGLDKDGSDDWTPSGISELKASVAPGSSITALLSSESDSIKVYYFKQGETSRPSVAWWTGSEGKWLTART